MGKNPYLWPFPIFLNSGICINYKENLSETGFCGPKIKKRHHHYQTKLCQKSDLFKLIIFGTVEIFFIVGMIFVWMQS